MLRTLCGFWTVLIVVALLTVSNFKKTDEELRLFHQLEENLFPQQTTIEEESENEATIGSIITSKDFMLLYAISFFQLFYGYYLLNVFKTLGAKTISNDQFLTLIGSVSSLFNGISKIFWSSLLDYFSFNRVFRTLVCLQLFLIATLLWSAQFPYLYMINVSLSVMCVGAMTSVLPTETLLHYLAKHLKPIFAAANFDKTFPTLNQYAWKSSLSRFKIQPSNF